MPSSDPLHDARERWNEQRAELIEHQDALGRALDELELAPSNPVIVRDVALHRSRFLWTVRALLELHQKLHPESRPPEAHATEPAPESPGSFPSDEEVKSARVPF